MIENDEGKLYGVAISNKIYFKITLILFAEKQVRNYTH